MERASVPFLQFFLSIWPFLELSRITPMYIPYSDSFLFIVDCNKKRVGTFLVHPFLFVLKLRILAVKLD
jgi:hypothetical protein